MNGQVFPPFLLMRTMAEEFSPADFAPPGWLENRHLQSVWPSLPLRRRGVLRGCATLVAASRQVLLDCGEGVQLSALHANQQAGEGPAAARQRRYGISNIFMITSASRKCSLTEIHGP